MEKLTAQALQLLVRLILECLFDYLSRLGPFIWLRRHLHRPFAEGSGREARVEFGEPTVHIVRDPNLQQHGLVKLWLGLPSKCKAVPLEARQVEPGRPVFIIGCSFPEAAGKVREGWKA